MRCARRTASLLAGLTLVLAATACGSDDGDDTAADTTTTTVVAPTETTSDLVPADVASDQVTFHAVLGDGPCEDLEEDDSAAPDDATAGDAPSEDDASELLPSVDSFWCYRVSDLNRPAVGVEEAEVVESSGTWTVIVRFTEESAPAMNELLNACHEGTEDCPAGEGGFGYVAVAVRGTVISAPSVAAPDLASDRIVIASGDLTEDEAQQLATTLRG